MTELLGLIAIALAIAALYRANRARRDIANINVELGYARAHATTVEQRLRFLERRLEELSQAGPATEASTPEVTTAEPASPRRDEQPSGERSPEPSARHTPVVAVPTPAAAPSPSGVVPPADSATPAGAAPPAFSVPRPDRVPTDVSPPSHGNRADDAELPSSDGPRGFPPAPTEPRPSFQWEQLLGVRGAAVLGGIVFSLAAVLFFQYSIEQGLIPPPVRVALVILVGLGAIVGSERLYARYGITANALAGGGAVALYGAFWAARVRYDLIPMWLAFALMALTTATCCLLSIRRSSLLVAVLGLAGGFATPLLLASGGDHPIGLFGYILLLDGGMLFVATRRRWGELSLLCLVATAVFEALWIHERLDPERIWLAVAIVALFTVVFVLGPRRNGSSGKIPTLLSQAGGVVFPYAVALYFASSTALDAPLVAIALLLALLGAGCAYLARQSETARGFPIAGASATVAVMGVWLAKTSLTPALAWEASLCSAGLALVYHLFVELGPSPGDTRRSENAGFFARFGLSAMPSSAWAALIAVFGLLASLIVGALSAEVATVWPWLCGWVALVILAYRLAALARFGPLQTAATTALAVALVAFSTEYAHHDGFASLGSYLLAEVALGVAALAVAFLLRHSPQGKHAAHAAAAFAVVVVLGGANQPRAAEMSPELALGGTALVAMTGVLSATLWGFGGWLAAVTAALALAHASWTDAIAFGSSEFPSSLATRAFALQAACVVVLTFYPALAGERFRGSRWGWYAAALAGVAWFTPLRQLYAQCFSASSIGVLPVALGVLALGALSHARTGFAPADPVRRSTVVWFSAVAIGFVSVAIPLQLHSHWITVGWALEGTALVALWVRLDHPGLKFLAGGLYVLSAARLVLLAVELGDYVRGENRIFNFTLYTYWVPAIAFLAGSLWLQKSEVSRARKREAALYQGGLPIVGIVAAGLALIVIFVWLNVAIADWFSPGERMVITFERQPARDLTTSLAWAVYAIVLLTIGTLRSERALRGVSLAVLLLTIGKVFLYDLSNLKDLYRVVSLLGLAVSLIGVSLAYQRFVFRSPRKEGSS